MTSTALDPQPAVIALALEIRRTTVSEYHRMIDARILDEDDRVELLEGLVVTMSPQKPPHATVIERLTDPEFIRLPKSFRVRCQLPLTLEDSEPEPDIAIVPRAGASPDRHPSHATIVVEVGRHPAKRDRVVKLRIYARAGIPEYLIADLQGKRLSVNMDPDPATGTYRSAVVLAASDRFESIAAPGIAFDVAELFAGL